METFKTLVSDKTAALRAELDRVEKRLNLDKLHPHTYELVIASFTAGSLATIACSRLHGRFWRRFMAVNDVPETYIREKRWIKGIVTSVGDGDNFRLYHTPGLGWRWPFKFRWVPTKSKELVNKTIHIRLAGVDAPEAAHFGRPGQRYAPEALEWLKTRIEGRTVYCQLVHRDQYQRIVAIPHIPPFFLPPPFRSLSPILFSRMRSRCVSIMMLKAGWAVVYEQAKGCYGVWGIDTFKKVEEEARVARRGIWQDGELSETPAAYKAKFARTAQPDEDPESIGGQADQTPDGSRTYSWLRWIFRR